MEPSSTSLIISENQETKKKFQKDEGKLRFLPSSSVPLLSFKPTEDNRAIEDFLQDHVNQNRLNVLEDLHMCIIPGPNTAAFLSDLAAMLAVGCQRIFDPRLKSEKVPDDFGFYSFEYGLEVDGNSPDTVIGLGQDEGPLKIPLLLLEEKLPLESLGSVTPQLSKYAKKTFAQKISFDEKNFGFESVYILALSQRTRQVKLIQYNRPRKDEILARRVKDTIEFGLFDNGTYHLNLNNVHDLFRVLLNCIFSQLKSLDLID